MLVTVIKDSVIYNGVIHANGKSFEADEKIAKSLIERGYVKPADTEGEADLQTGYLDESQLEEMSYPDLKSLAAQMGLDSKGTKKELIKRICATKVEAEGEAVIEEDAAPEEESAGDLPNTSMPE